MKKIMLLIFLVSTTSLVFGQEITRNTTKTITQSGIGLGSVIAVVTSWDRNKSILWAILSGILSWVYVIYYALSRENYDNSDDDQEQSHLFKIDYDQYNEDKNK